MCFEIFVIERCYGTPPKVVRPVNYEKLDLWWEYVTHTDRKHEYAQVNQFLNYKIVRLVDP